MKRLSANIRVKISLFLLIVCAVVVGNLLSDFLLRKDADKLAIAIEKVEHRLSQKLDKLEKDNQYHRTQMEQAQKERDGLKRALVYHQRLLDAAKAAASTTDEQSK